MTIHRDDVERALSYGLTEQGMHRWWHAENELLGMDTPREAWTKGHRIEVLTAARQFMDATRS